MRKFRNILSLMVFYHELPLKKWNFKDLSCLLTINYKFFYKNVREARG